MPPAMFLRRIGLSWLLVALILAGCEAGNANPVQLQLPATAETSAWVTLTPSAAPSPAATPLADPPTASPTAALQVLADNELQNQVSRAAAAFMKGGRNPGLSVAIVTRNAQTGALEAMLLNFGATAKDGGQPIASDTVYEIGSITKVFTGVLLAQAVVSSRMGLKDSIQLYLPPGVQAPNYQGIPITLGELATHRSGLPRDPASDSLPALYDWLNAYRLTRAPGSEYVYSNLAYALLGDILARNAGTDYASLVRGAVSVPLGLMDTTEALSAGQRQRLAQGYASDGSVAAYFPDSGAMSGAGYLRSTLNDLTEFLIENLQPAATPLAASLTLAQKVESEGRNPGTGTALGWEIDQLGKSGERLWKSGATPGFSSYISLRTDGSSGFVLLSNGQSVDSLAPLVTRLSDPGAN